MPAAQVALLSVEERRVRVLLSQNIAISMHDHPVVIPEAHNEMFEQKRLGRDFTGFGGWLEGERCDLRFGHAFV